MNDIRWQTYGEDIVILCCCTDGGLNGGGIWHCIRENSARIYAVSGRLAGLWSQLSGFGAMTLEDMTAQVAKNAPTVKLSGFTFCGPAASQMALNLPLNASKVLVTVALRHALKAAREGCRINQKSSAIPAAA